MSIVRVSYLVPVEVTVDSDSGDILDIIVCADRLRPNVAQVCYAGTNIAVPLDVDRDARMHLDAQDLVRGGPEWRIES